MAQTSGPTPHLVDAGSMLVLMRPAELARAQVQLDRYLFE
jgi:hypothetical protein